MGKDKKNFFCFLFDGFYTLGLNTSRFKMFFLYFLDSAFSKKIFQ